MLQEARILFFHGLLDGFRRKGGALSLSVSPSGWRFLEGMSGFECETCPIVTLWALKADRNTNSQDMRHGMGLLHSSACSTCDLRGYPG